MAEPLLFIPGLGCTPRLFADQAAAIGSGRDIIFADHSADATIAGIAGRLLANAPPRFALAGLSMGGYVALEVMRLAQARVTRLALLDTTARPDTEEASDRRRRLIALAEGGRFGDIHGLLWDRLVHPDRLRDAELDGVVRGMLVETGPDAFVRQQRAIMGRMDSRPYLRAIATPTLVVVGEADAITPPEHAEEMANAIPAAQLVRVPASGHLSTLERPDEVSLALIEWLER
jgi:pimeloyl-ACP methyl ester carboxylesterase